MSWSRVIEQEKKEEYFISLKKSIDHRYQTTTVYPPKDKIFRAFSLAKYEELKVVIIGQDPYHGEGQAQGLAFSTPSNIKNPPSLQNILKEIESDIGRVSQNSDGDLTSWANQGVLLINTILTVESARAKSHHNLGWEIFTHNIITHINSNFKDIIFILWGANAISMRRLIDEDRHHILTAPHPSPLSSYRGFFGCRHFSKTNQILKKLGKDEILW
jgi:uracil-DNA glycosylase